MRKGLCCNSPGACWGILVGYVIDFFYSWADAGRGCGTCEHFGQLDSGGHGYSLHQDAREEEDLRQRQLPVSNRYPFLAITAEPLERLSVPLLSPPASEKIRQTAGITAVFVNVERLSSLSAVSSCDVCPLTAYRRSLCTNWVFLHVQREMEEAWGFKVFDRYSLVLHIFRCNARTKEAKLQISLAEIPLLR